MVTLLLLPGLDGTGDLFAPFVTALGADFNVVIARYPGDKALGYAELESIARATLPNNEPYIILGESFSGPIAISLAASAPAQLKGLVLCCTFARNPRPAFTALRPLLHLLPTASMSARLMSHLLLGKFSNTKLRSMIRQSMARISVAALRARLRAVLAVDVSNELEKTKIPLLYLRASQDRVVPRAASELIARLCRHAKIVELEAPHFLLQAAPLDASRIVSEFMREVETTL